MIRVARLVPSRPMYAFDPATFSGQDYRHGGHRYLKAVWFRRKNGLLVASVGSYGLWLNWGQGDPPPDDYETWVAAHTDNRYGGGHLASWNGEALLCSDQPVTTTVAAERIEFLSKMLAGFPDVPPGFDGWWAFEKRIGNGG